MSFLIISHRNKTIKVRIGPQWPLRDQFFATCRTFFIARSQCGNYAVAAESMKAFLRRHRLLEHIQADWTPKNNIKSIIFFKMENFHFTSTRNEVSEAIRQFLSYLWWLPAAFDLVRREIGPMSCFEFVVPWLKVFLVDFWLNFVMTTKKFFSSFSSMRQTAWMPNGLGFLNLRNTL
jgi:hypothetical protein